MSRKKDIDKMREWFFEHYDDPANLLPYDSGEGGYITIYGSLEYSDDILYNEFLSVYKEEKIKKLVDELGDYNLWSPRPNETWYGHMDDYLLISPSSIIDDTIEELNAISSQTLLVCTIKSFKKHSQGFLQMLFARIYAIAESFLANFLINYIEENFDEIIKNINTFPDIKKINFPITDICKNFDAEDFTKEMLNIVKQTIYTYYMQKIWHRFDEAKSINSHFEIKISLKDSALEKYIHIRHDIVHRAGRRKEAISTKHIIDQEILVEITEAAKELVNSIQSEYKRIEVKKREKFELQMLDIDF